MIETLSIRNIALIDELELELASGLNIFTGETGAGKSVILKSIGLVLGERASADIVREGADFAKVEASVAPDDTHPMWHTDFGFSDVLDASDMVILSRQISANGRSRCHINGRLVNLKQLQALGTLLVDIHGQHEHQSLFRTETHLKLLDDFGGSSEARQQVGKVYTQLRALQQEAASLADTLAASEREKDLLEFEIKELTAANLEEGEDEKLADEARVLKNAEKLSQSANYICDQLDGSNRSGGFDGGAMGTDLSTLDRLKDAANALTDLLDLDGSLSELQNRLESSLYELEDIALQIRQYADTVEFNQRRLDEIADRLALIAKLKRRYGNTISEILAYHAEAEQKLETLQLGSEKQESLQTEIQKTIQEAQHLSTALSAKRLHVAKHLSERIEKELRTLGMDKAEFQASVQHIPDERGPFQVNGKRYAFRSDGMDAVEFLIAPNVGSEARPIARIASGGEISRIMLALKTVLVQVDEIPTLLFDEIDSGIGGKVADVVGKKLKELSAFSQVICITHLPQIARFADKHFRVEKKVVDERTLITAKPLTVEEQVNEISRMHGGEETEIGLAHARELLSDKKPENDSP
ncbi:DNA repair protein RecN [Candidatus Poribacteria bacterium]|nr:MAG: DNA repair protein RecN [Candidatus Poribacteria bacterium]